MIITPRLRPRLEMFSPLPPADLIAHVQQRLAAPDCPCLGLVTDEQIELRIHPDVRRYWSPQLVVHVTSRGDSSHLEGHFGPDAHVWTLFLAIYAFVILSATFGAFYGIAQLVLGRPPWALLSIPIAAVLVVLIYVAAGVGQRLGHDQVDVLQDFLEESVRRG